MLVIDASLMVKYKKSGRLHMSTIDTITGFIVDILPYASAVALAAPIFLLLNSAKNGELDHLVGPSRPESQKGINTAAPNHTTSPPAVR